MGKYATFSGRATRSEFWWFYLFVTVFGWLTMLVDSYVVVNDIGAINLIFQLVMAIPCLAAGARRYHDINRSGWWQLLAFTLILIPLTIYWYAKKGDANKNRYDTEDQSSKTGEAIDSDTLAHTEPASDKLSTLEKLHDMKERGVITEQEYEVKKGELLR
tara:strand:+ start:159 stop:638 length:480 start_codon:yes stop_codon:yes gene_type:complete